MAPLTGTAGSVVTTTGGTTVIGELSEWALDISMSPVETTAFGDNWAEYIPSIRNATGSFAGNFDPADAAQGTMISSALGGSAVGLRLYASGSKYFNLPTVYITGLSPSISQAGKADISYSFQNSGSATLV